MKRIIRKFLQRLGYDFVKVNKGQQTHPDIRETEFWELYQLCRPYTMTSLERLYSLYQAVNYVLDQRIPGCLVECGVWKGGSAMLMAQLLHLRGVTDRKIYLYDTFEGMSAPSDADSDFRGHLAQDLLEKTPKTTEQSIWCFSPLDEVKQNLAVTGFPAENICFIQGKVENTIPEHLPESEIALLRLDTDFYESTQHELVHLYPLLETGAPLIIDDYGHWAGCRRAVDEFFDLPGNKRPLFTRVDYTARIGLKI